MDNLNKIPTWRKVLIVVFALIVVVCLILLGNIDNIINESEKNKPSLIFEQDKILSRLLSFNELSDEQQREFQLDQEDRLNKYVDTDQDTYVEACNILYNNLKFKDIFSEELIDSLKSIGANYDDRCKILRNKVVSDAFNYLYSPFTSNGIRDNRKGLGTDWEEYNQMSIPAKENYIRSDFQHKYEIIVEKENRQRNMLGSILYAIILASGLGVFYLISAKIGKKNLHARYLAIYTIACVALNIIIYGVMAINNINSDETLAFVLFDFLPSIVVLSVTERFLAKKSYQDYQSYYLIPKWLSDSFNLTKEFRKRLLMIFLIYPFFFVVPLPVIGMFFLGFYILPVLLILGIIWTVLWIREGKKMDGKPQVQNDKARLYCRHCGKLIDADSDYCRYCGKKL